MRRLCIELEGHGREDIFPGLNVSRTVGWFTTLFPLVLDLTDALDLDTALKRVKETLLGIPHHGMGYGALRYLSAETDPSLETHTEVRFNYFGQTDQMFPVDGPFGPAPESSGASRSPHDHCSILIDINGLVTQGQLRLYWTYSEAIHRRATIEHLANAFMATLRQLIQHCLAGDSNGYTPSDFPHMQLSQDALDQLLERL
jgi:non-ribosomal peptide synthase protein (TIGR01720 family)